MLPLHLLATGKAYPADLVTAARLDELRGFAPGTSLAKSGVQMRWYASSAESQSTLGAKALIGALHEANLARGEIDLLIAACGVPEQALPSTACAIAAAAKLPAGTPAFDVNASCLSFLQALQVASALLATGSYKRIAVVSSDLASRGIDHSDLESSLIFGDGAAAAILELPPENSSSGLLAYSFQTYPEGREFCEIRAGGTRRNPRVGVEDRDFLFRMNGKAVFKLAARLMDDFVEDLLAKAGVGLQEIDWVVPHQASHLGMAHIIKRLGLPEERVVNIYSDHGNQVAASIPTALHELMVSGRAERGQKVMLLGTAAGMSIGGAVLVL